MLLIDDNHKIKKEWFWFAIFAIFITLFVLTDFAFITDYDSNNLKKLYEDPPFSYHILYKANIIFSILMLLWFLKKLKKYRIKIKDYYSFIEPIQLLWIRNFTLINIGMNVCLLIIFVLYNFGIIKKIESTFLALSGVMVTSYFYLSYNGIKQYSLAEFVNEKRFNIEKERTEVEISEISNSEKYKSSSLSDNEIEILFEQIIDLFEKENLYLEPQLKIQDIASRLNVTANKISQTLNSKAEKPFYDFVNEYRIQHFKNLLSKPENKRFTILALGLDSGFNSKASLNRIFKQQTGLSPSEFQKNNLFSKAS